MAAPYYSHDGITIYHGDCREILQDLPTVDLVLADPPYGINLDTDFSTLKGNASFNADKGSYNGKVYSKVHGDDQLFDPAVFLRWPCILFGANHYANRLPTNGTWHIWDKRDGLGQNMMADFEMWWTSYSSGPSRIFRHKWLGYFRASEVGEHYHPTQKPLALMHYIMKSTPPGTILDPFMGSGPTLQAAKDFGRKAIGIEIEEKYCEIAAQRLSQEVLAFG